MRSIPHDRRRRDVLRHDGGLVPTAEQAVASIFGDDSDDSYGAREIINGDKHIVPSWSGGVSIGKLIAGYHDHFLQCAGRLVAAEEGHG